MYILILTQSIENKSIDLLKSALQKQIDLLHSDITVQVWEIHPESISIEKNSIQYRLGNPISVDFSDLHLVIKRTWGPIRDFALSICRSLEENDVPILNGCDYISWSHSKIQQYQAMEKYAVFPHSICIETNEHPFEKINSAINENFSYPVVIKTDRGCRADGIYLIESQQSLQHFIQSDLFTHSRKKHAFLIQQFILTNDDPTISTYYRINLVDMKPQSAARFNLKWQLDATTGLQKLIDPGEADDQPMPLDFFDATQLKKIIDACPYEHDVSGIDLICDSTGKIYLLEFNDGPAISAIVDLAAQSPTQNNASEQCAQFADAIAEFSLQKFVLRNSFELVYRV